MGALRLFAEVAADAFRDGAGAVAVAGGAVVWLLSVGTLLVLGGGGGAAFLVGCLEEVCFVLFNVLPSRIDLSRDCGMGP